MSYLNTPRLSFSGKFQADPSTVNNDVTHYDNSNFRASYQDYGLGAVNGWWNPNGSGGFRLVGCTVKSVTYKDGTTTTERSADPVIGMSIMDANTRVAGKMVDLDPQQQMVSMIYGMKVRLVNPIGSEIFSGDYKPAAFNNIWFQRRADLQPSSKAASASYQSLLTGLDLPELNITGSRYLRELSEMLPDQLYDQLSIKFNVDLYEDNMYLDAGLTTLNPSFTLGRLVGNIGPSFTGEPTHFVKGRQFFSAGTNSNNFATAVLNNSSTEITLDLSNSLQTTGADGALIDIGMLKLSSYESTTETSPTIYGKINYQETGFYETYGGIATIPISEADKSKATDFPLCIRSEDNSVLMDEAVTYCRADNFVFRLNPGDTDSIEIYATTLGTPVNQGTNINLSQNPSTLPPQTGEPNTCTPTSALILDISNPRNTFTSAVTNEKGVASFPILAADPENPRAYIDGQIYALWYNFDNGYVPTATSTAPNSVNQTDFISILVHDKYPEGKKSPKWEMIQPIMQQYANLYPLMSKGIFDLSKQSVVDKNAKILHMVFSLPIEDPNYMPVTRDLSRDKRSMILSYLESQFDTVLVQ